MLADVSTVTRKELRQFGLVMGAAIALVFGIVLPWLWSHAAPPWLWIVVLVLWSLALVAPPVLRPVYRGWMKVGAVLAWVNTRIILGLVFYGMVTPMAAVMRLLGYDPMHRAFDASADSYRITRPSGSATIDLEKPY